MGIFLILWWSKVIVHHSHPRGGLIILSILIAKGRGRMISFDGRTLRFSVMENQEIIESQSLKQLTHYSCNQIWYIILGQNFQQQWFDQRNNHFLETDITILNLANDGIGMKETKQKHRVKHPWESVHAPIRNAEFEIQIVTQSKLSLLAHTSDSEYEQLSSCHQSEWENQAR
jgi:hypothetical protein